MRTVIPSIVAIALSAMTASAQDSLRLRIDAPSEVRRGARVPVTVRVENVADRALDLYLRGREIVFDVVVRGDDGTVVWRRLEGEIVPAILQLKSLAPREVLELRAAWTQRTNDGRTAPPGSYSVHALVLTESETPLATDAVGLRILAR